MFVARKVALGKWRKNKGLSPGEIPADAVTLDLKTKENALSFWRCDDRDGVADVALAMAAEGDHLDGLDIVLVPVAELRKNQQTLDPTDGKTPVTDLVRRHINVCHIDHVRLGSIAASIAFSVTAEQYHRFPRSKVRQLLLKAVKDGRLHADELKGSVKDDIKQKLDADFQAAGG